MRAAVMMLMMEWGKSKEFTGTVRCSFHICKGDTPLDNLLLCRRTINIQTLDRTLTPPINCVVLPRTLVPHVLMIRYNVDLNEVLK